MKKSYFGFTLLLSILILGLTVFPTQTSFSDHPNEVLVTEEGSQLRVHISDPDGINYVIILDSEGEEILGIFPPGCPTHVDSLIFTPESGESYSVQWEDCLGDVMNVDPLPDPILDSDNDSVIDSDDNCPTTPNTDQTDTDGDGVGDVCNDANDADGDEWNDILDNCPTTPNTDQADTDGDGVGDVCDKNGKPTGEKKSCEALKEAETKGNGKHKGIEKAKSNNGCNDP